MADRARAEQLLRRLTASPTAAFRPGQWEAIDHLVGNRGRALVVQRTGWGKSAVYFVATRMLRDAGAGPTLLVSPLLALMRNQIQMAERAGVAAATINSTNRADWEEIEEEVRAGRVDILLISPERLNNERFRSDVLPALAATVGLLVVDEAHCISDWGHDFRPDYRRISRVLGLLPRAVPVLCTTATANDRVVADVVDQLGHDLRVIRGPLDRETLALSVLDLPGQPERLAWLAQVLPQLPGSGIVYCLTVADSERVAGWLRTRGIDAVAYSGGTDPADRLDREDALLANRVKAVVATSALGMGFDKADLTFVVHFQSPGSPIAYYQQVGRAGRGVDRADGVLLRGWEDAEIQDYFIRIAFPPKEQAERVVALLAERAEPVSMAEIEAVVNARRGRIEAMLKVLEVEGAVERVGGRWLRTLQPWRYDEERVERITALRRDEQAAMVAYGRTTGCRMAFLRAALDDPGAAPCGRCDRCTGATSALELDPALVAAAGDFLRSAPLEIEPRRQWAHGLGSPKGRIPAELQVEPGRALALHGDGGYGGLIKHAKDGGTRYPDELVDATVKLLGRWRPDPAPAWLTWIPSTTTAGLVDELASRLAEALGIPAVEAVRRTRPGRPQKEMENSAQQVRNVYGAFEVFRDVPELPVLLLDDIVDSRWTITVVGAELRRAGVPAVVPLALAEAVSD